MPPPRSPIPAGLDWDLWLGPTAQRDFYRDYLPLKWRAFYDFGSGMLGDFGCHTFDTPVWALDLDPRTINDTLGVLLKYQDDIQRLQGSEAAEILRKVKSDIAAQPLG